MTVEDLISLIVTILIWGMTFALLEIAVRRLYPAKKRKNDNDENPA